VPSVLITGASRGIGRATAVEFASNGYRVVATARSLASLDGLAVDQRLILDVTDQKSVDDAIAKAGDIDVLVSNAGSVFHGSIEASPPDEVARLYDSNTVGALRVVQAVLPQMRERASGRLLFVSSVTGRVALPGSGAYAASKWALEAIVETLAMEVQHLGLIASLLEPGPVRSGALGDVPNYALSDDPYSPVWSRRAGFRPLILTPEEVAAAILEAAQRPSLPLRVPIGRWAREVLAKREAGPFDSPFALLPTDL
jgi:NADP-dependent 3-hydroxy acid dehydrogenase YdfG